MATNTILCDFLIIGGGIIGLSVARCLKNSFSDASIVILEKEGMCGWHASGRNSGVLHAGFYYTPDSLKAKFTRLGNQLLTTYCEEKKLPINKCGKLVVAKNEQDLQGLAELLKRGRHNGVHLTEVTAEEAKEIEPRAVTYQRALFSPTTSSVNPKSVLAALQKDAEEDGIQIHCGVQYLARQVGNTIRTTVGKYQASYIVNAAGLYADNIARDFDFSKNYRSLPFKGIYLYADEPVFSMKTHIYPVPDLKNPFLGVHFTVSVDGKVKIGPTAIPAFWREQYGIFERFKLTEFIDIVSRQISLLTVSQFDFKRLALEEMKKYSKPYLVKLAAQLATAVKKENYTKFGPPGIRAQLLNMQERKLEMDFVLEGDNKSMHILNAVSPGFTSSLPFAQHVCEQIYSLINR
ncbi:MAG: FAD-dependent oxidoreductase [Gammaproteobacteria bacterium RIFCSPHIGHO2_12_FULL_37_14]|nr:MAG: FAD-dependent oxidoreductase [Gammaproteobacteria bacterium RIFCSPHIGHO2_12_FULL_37_14]